MEEWGPGRIGAGGGLLCPKNRGRNGRDRSNDSEREILTLNL